MLLLTAGAFLLKSGLARCYQQTGYTILSKIQVSKNLNTVSKIEVAA
jgi:hypothetical protein